MDINKLQDLAKLIRYLILTSTTTAGSGHPTTSLSSADLMTTLFFGGLARRSLGEGGFFHFDLDNPDNPANDRLVFSKGHASPLFYSLYAAAGVIEREDLIKNYRKFESILEGHPTPRFKYTEAATGSLGQGLSVGFGLALALKSLQLTTYNLQPHVYVLLGDGEMAEGSIWEAINLASYYKLDNLVAILDVNRLGQSQETMLGWDTKTYEKRFQAFGWKTVVVDGHNYKEIIKAYQKAVSDKDTLGEVARRDSPDGGGISQKPFAIIAKTIKGKGVSFLENKEGWHGKPLSADQLKQALVELGEVDLDLKCDLQKPKEAKFKIQNSKFKITIQNLKLNYKLGDQVATRKAYGTALARLGEVYPNIVSLDAEVKNSTYSEIFKEKFPERFFEMFIAEQNMVGAAVGFSRMGFIPFVSTFSAFLTRAFDQIRMAAISGANVKFCGSHAGVSIGEDGPSQMGLEDLSMFRAIHGSVVLYPSDAVSTEKLVEEMVKHKGICYLRTSRPATPVIYKNEEKFPIGGCKIHKLPKSPRSYLKTYSSSVSEKFSLRSNNTDFRGYEMSSRLLKSLKKIVIIAAGVTLYEALKAQEELVKEGIEAIVVDCYSIKPIDKKTLLNLTKQGPTLSPIVLMVEDHWFEGGLGDAVLNVFTNESSFQFRKAIPIQDRKAIRVYKMAVEKMPRSGKPNELLDFEGISAKAIIAKVKSLL